MAFLNSIKRALGLDPTDNDELNEGIDATVHPLSTHRQQSVSAPDQVVTQPQEPQTEPMSEPQTPDDEMKIRIFEHVVAIFDESLPEFLKSSVDADAQRQYIYQTLDQSIKDYLTNLESAARSYQRDSWMRDRQRLESETHELRDKLKDADDKVANWSQRQLSNDRQIRTLKERVHDLETQVNSLEAEKEQFQLENRSLVNKLRVSAVQMSDEDVDLATKLTEITDKYKIAETMVSELTSEAATAKSEASVLAEKLRQSNNDLEAKSQQLDTLKAELASAQSNVLTAHDEIDSLKQQLTATQAELKEANEDLETVAQLEEAVDKFEDAKAAKDNRINQLSAENNRLQLLIDSHKNEIAALKRTIEANLDTQVKNEGKLLERIASLEDEIAHRPTIQLEDIPEEPITEQPKQKRKRKPKISAIDDSIDDTAWLVSTPPPGKSIVAEPDPEFGYQEPTRKPAPQNDAQLSLW